MKQKFLLLLGALILIFAGTEAKTINRSRIIYALDSINSTASVTSNTLIDSTLLIIPDTVIDNQVTYHVRSIADSAFLNCSALKNKLIIEAALTSIGNKAFQGCSKITGIVLPSTLTTIGNYAFDGCSGATDSTNIGAQVATIGISAFRNCKSKLIIDGANLNYSSLNGVMFNKDKSTLIQGPVSLIGNLDIPSTVVSIGTYALYKCTGLTGISIPSSVTNIGNYAFSGCSGLKGTFTIPSTVTTIGAYALQNCTGITKLVTPALHISLSVFPTDLQNFTLNGSIDARDFTFLRDSVSAISEIDLTNATILAYTGKGGPESSTISKVYKANTIPQYSFDKNSDLTSIKFPLSITEIGIRAFNACKNLSGDLILPAKVTTIGDYAFQGCEFTGVTLPNSLTTISTGVFSGMSNLSTIIVPDSVTKIGNNAFEYCSNVTSITIPNSVTSIGTYAFYECGKLTSLNLPDSLTTIGNYACYLCNSLTSVRIPTKLTTIGSYAFFGCTGLTEFTFPETVKTIGTYAFSGCTGLTNIKIPEAVTSITDYSFSGCTKLDTVTVSSLTTSIGSFAFNKCSSLRKADVPALVKTIGTCAFSDCTALMDMSIPATVTSIGDNAYSNCSAPLFVDNTNPNYSSLDSLLFNKAKTTLLQCPISKSGSYSIPESVTTISAYSFYNCDKLTDITVPASVTSIDNAAFFNCSGLISLTVLSQIPVDLSSSANVFYNINKNCTLFVPAGSKSAYEAANQWNGISKIVESPTALNTPSDNNFSIKIINGQLIVSDIEAGKTIEIFSLQGVVVERLISTNESTTINLPTKGIYIVRVGNKTEKIVNN